LSSGLVPPASESGWNVEYEPALVAWLRTGPSGEDAAELLEWVKRAKQFGPPDSGIGDDSDYFIDRVSNRVTVGYLVSGWDRWMRIRHIF
jgi:hypothetical protein